MLKVNSISSVTETQFGTTKCRTRTVQELHEETRTANAGIAVEVTRLRAGEVPLVTELSTVDKSPPRRLLGSMLSYESKSDYKNF